MNSSFQNSPVKQKLEKDVSFTVLRPLDFKPDLGKPHQTSEIACVQFGPIPWCAGLHCVPPWPDLLSLWATALSQLLWLPWPSSGVLAYLKHYPGLLWAPHSSHTTLYYWANLPKYSHCPAKNVHCFFVDGSKITKKTQTANLLGCRSLCYIYKADGLWGKWGIDEGLGNEIRLMFNSGSTVKKKIDKNNRQE